MASFDFERGISSGAAGAFGGAGTGAAIGAAGGPIGAGAGALIGGALGLAQGFFGGSKSRNAPNIDISKEIARIRALFAEQRRLAAEGLRGELADLQFRTASDLAGRGIFRSPVAEFSRGQNRAAFQKALGSAIGQISSREAGTLADLLSRLSGQKLSFEAESRLREEERRDQSRRDLLGFLSGSGSDFLKGLGTSKTDTTRAGGLGSLGLFKPAGARTSPSSGFGERVNSTQFFNDDFKIAPRSAF